MGNNSIYNQVSPAVFRYSVRKMIIISVSITIWPEDIAVLHQLAKQIDKDAPHIDKIGQEAVSSSIKSVGYEPPTGKKLFLTALVGDLISNTIYYSLIGKGKKQNLLLRGIVYGTVAGIGALKLTKPMGLDDEPVNKTKKTQAMTIAWYVIGGVVSVYAMKFLEKRAVNK